MKAKRIYHVTAGTTGQWIVRRSGSDRAEKAFVTKKDAVEFAKARARRIGKNEEVELYIHQRDGRISEIDSYGADPAPPKTHRH